MTVRKTLHQVLLEAEVLLQSRNFSEALALLRSTELLDATGDERAHFCMLISEAGLFVGEYSEELIDEAIEAYRFDRRPELFAKAKYLKGWLLTSLGKHSDAKEHLLEAYAGYLRCNDKVSAVRPLNYLAYAQLQCGEMGSATANLERCIEILDAAGKTEAAAIRKMNLASTHRLIGDLVKSIDLYESIESEILLQGSKNISVYYIECALALAQQGKLPQARAVLAEAEPQMVGLTRETALLHEKSGWIELLDGRFVECRKALRAGLEISLRIAPESSLISQIKRLQADCAVATGKFSEARKHATEALAVAEKIGQRLEIAACYRVFAQVAVAAGKSDEARDWFYKSIDMFNQISARYELAVARYVAATSGMFERSESVALLFLAKEYCEAEQVAPYIAKIDTALAKLEPRNPSLAPINRTIDGPLIAANKKMLSLLDLARHVAPTNMTVLLTGETGTGKDLMARYIHEQSGCTGQFVSQNVTTLPATMFEAELFGYKKGAYTGAVDERKGLIKFAEHGTLFLNEIGEASTELQTKLLEVLETRRIRRIGENQDQPVEFRLIAATNADLAECVRSGKFRADLYHRLNQAAITLPPLRDRIDDIAPLVRHFLASLGETNGDESAISELITILSSYAWPGNVRELEHTIRRLWVTNSGSVTRMSQAVSEDLAHIEDSSFVAVIAECGGNKSKAARMLGVSEGTIRYRLKQGN